MREIKFRGNSGGKWIYGCLNKTYHSEYCPAILKDTEHTVYSIIDCFYDDRSEYEVDSKSIGQYTGLKDKSGTEIYERDFIEVGNCDEVGLVIYDKDNARFCIQFGDMVYEFSDLEYGKNLIIGNEYDNPELLWWE